jgi:hypothetical protein
MRSFLGVPVRVRNEVFARDGLPWHLHRPAQPGGTRLTWRVPLP